MIAMYGVLLPTFVNHYQQETRIAFSREISHVRPTIRFRAMQTPNAYVYVTILSPEPNVKYVLQCT